jgi:outer membrane receptor protein involved in Fe transport
MQQLAIGDDRSNLTHRDDQNLVSLTNGNALQENRFGYRFVRSDRRVDTISLFSNELARVDNATDTLYRDHLNYLKDLAPEMGRNFRVVYSVKF